MKGTTHLAIGAAIGVAAAAYYPLSLTNSVLYIAVASFSALSADLDGPSLLSSKLGKISKLFQHLVLGSGVFLTASVLYLHFFQHLFYQTYTMIAVTTLLLGFVAREGFIRNALVSLVGLGLIYSGLDWKMTWLIAFGVYVAWVPWLKHRGMTHTVWAFLLWGVIGWGLEQQLQIQGITIVSMAGYLSHLLADTSTPSGVKWFYPLYKKSIKLHF
jgi:inner membrane protein